MKITTTNTYKDWIIRKLQGLVWRLENTGNAKFDINGELSFVSSICNQYAGKPFIAFDIGANVGEYTEMILKYTQSDKTEIHLFEPQKTCFETITQKFSTKSQIHLNNIGLSDSAETTTLYKDFDQSGLASVHQRNLSHYDIQMNETEEITLTTALSYIQEKNIEKINLIKIDVEGHELAALGGFGKFLSPENIDFIQFEYGGANLDSHTSLLELFTFFEAKGFVLCKMMPNGLEIQSYKPRFENFMYQNWVAVNPAQV
jgi:FkbM family methyltransferase